MSSDNNGGKTHCPKCKTKPCYISFLGKIECSNITCEHYSAELYPIVKAEELPLPKLPSQPGLKNTWTVPPGNTPIYGPLWKHGFTFMKDDSLNDDLLRSTETIVIGPDTSGSVSAEELAELIRDMPVLPETDGNPLEMPGPGWDMVMFTDGYHNPSEDEVEWYELDWEGNGDG